MNSELLAPEFIMYAGNMEKYRRKYRLKFVLGELRRGEMQVHVQMFNIIDEGKNQKKIKRKRSIMILWIICKVFVTHT